MPTKAQRCAEGLITVVPPLMQALRVEMRAGRAAEFTVPQFRTLVFFQVHPGAPLTQAAEHLGVSLPAASKLAEGLAARGLLTRSTSRQDRRRLSLSLTLEGRRHLEASRSAAVAGFAQRLSGLSDMELDVLLAVLDRLKAVAGLPEETP